MTEHGEPYPALSVQLQHVPEFLGRYRIERAIGSGGMGTVYLAEDTALGRKVAVKILAQELARTPQQRERFLREARAAAQVTSPWVIAIHEVGEEGGLPFIVMEYVEGDSLAGVLSDWGRLSVKDGVDVVGHVARALEAAHGRGILHRDIKPDNILLPPDGRVRVTDFGVAKLAEASVLTRTGEVMGTAAYMAPEQALGESVDGRSDLYSLGCVAYEVFTGRPPFEADSQIGLVYRHVNEDPAPPSLYQPEIPPALEAVILRLLAKSPPDRFQTAQDLVLALEDLRGRDPEDVPPRSARRTQETTRALLGETPVAFIGRGAELEQLTSLLQRVVAGRGAVRFIAGKAGVGKTRLLGELEQHARRRGVRFLKGMCLYQEGTIPYQPFVSAIRSYFRAARRDTNREEREAIKEFLRNDAPELRTLVPQVGTVIGPLVEQARPQVLEDREWERERLFEGISTLIKKISEYRPVVLFLDDLHWADQGSLKLLHYVASACADHPILLVGAYRTEEILDRDGDREAPLLDITQRLSREGLSETLHLPEFSEGEVADLLVHLLPGDGVDPDLSEVLHRETCGNALFVLELAKLLEQEGTLVADGGVWRWVGRMDAAPIPTRVRDVLARRVDHLATQDREILECAAIVGDPFDAGLISRVLGRRKIELLRDLQPLEKRCRMIRCEADGFHFDHPKLQEVIYEDIPLEMRKELHRLVADEIEAGDLTPEQRVFPLARHYYRAGDLVRAYPVLKAAADQALDLYAYEERSLYLRRALEAFEKSAVPPEEELHVQLELGETAVILGEWRDAEKALDQSLSLSRRAEDRAGQARSLAALGLCRFRQSDWDQARQRYEESLAVYEALGDFRGVAQCRIGIGNVAFESGQWGEAGTRYRTALDEGAGNQLEDIQARASNNLGAVSNASGRHHEAVQWYEKGLAFFQDLGEDLGAARAYHNLGMTYLDLEQWEKAEMYLRQSLEISTRIRQPEMISITFLLLGDLCFRQGDYSEARGHCLKALSYFKRRGDRPGEADAYRILGAVLAAEGCWEEAMENLRRSLEINLACGQRLQSAETEWEVARLDLKQGSVSEADVHLKQAAEWFRRLGAESAAVKVEEDLAGITRDPDEHELELAGLLKNHAT